MSDENILEETEEYRVSVEIDDYPESPLDMSDLYPPTVRMDIRKYTRDAEHIDGGSRPRDADGYVADAIHRWGGPSSDEWYLVEKYLRAFHGVTRIDTYSSGDYWYIAYDSAAWRDYAGAQPAAESDENLLHDLEAWIEGDVYSYVIERKVHVSQNTRRTYRDGTADDSSREYDTWEYAEGSGGFYGYDWAKQSALDAFSRYTEQEN